MTADDTANPVFGWIGFCVGALALFAALFVFWAGPFAPQHSAGVTLGELAAEIGKSTLRAAAGLDQPSCCLRWVSCAMKEGDPPLLAWQLASVRSYSSFLLLRFSLSWASCLSWRF
ncbi:hypothetical protein [Ruegeria sp. HKCCA6707]|uniref:hypothetical protein n=1 Tax=Ruegeria sp. HKCCA6707 TaxID=2682996 RepID=UPI001489553C|nr:hypothetical protein [Ruegeria sp. HKCCA6707]